MPESSISVIMPALNEEKNVAASVAAVQSAFDRLCQYEIIIFDDGSRDQTGRIADDIAAHDPRIRVVHNPTNQGIGFCYWTGVELARHDYILMVPGDDETPADTIRAIGQRVGTADLVITYTMNGHIRPLHRRVFSRMFTIMMNALFGLRLRYYNGNCLIRTALLHGVPRDTSGFSYMAALLVRLLKQGCSYVEAGILLQPRGQGGSKATSPRSVLRVLKSVLALVWEIRIPSVGKLGVGAAGSGQYPIPRRSADRDASVGERGPRLG